MFKTKKQLFYFLLPIGLCLITMYPIHGILFGSSDSELNYIDRILKIWGVYLFFYSVYVFTLNFKRPQEKKNRNKRCFLLLGILIFIISFTFLFSFLDFTFQFFVK
jgi:hypothetical protein